MSNYCICLIVSQAEELIKREMVTMLHYDGILEPVVLQADSKLQHAAYLKDHPHEDIDIECLASVRTVRFYFLLFCIIN